MMNPTKDSLVFGDVDDEKENLTENKPIKKQTKVHRMQEVAQHWDRDSCWMVVDDNVYDITDFIRLVSIAHLRLQSPLCD